MVSGIELIFEQMECAMVTAGDVMTVASWLGVAPSLLLSLRTSSSTVKQNARVNSESLTEREQSAARDVSLAG